MKKSARTFIAIKIVPENEFLEIYKNIKDVLADEAIKWVDTNNFHITLRFLGDTTQQQIEETALELDKIVSDYPSFYLRLAGIDFFENKGMPKVLFAKTKESKALTDLADEINLKIVELGFKSDIRKFKSHLTLGRIRFLKNKNKFKEIAKKYDNTKFQKDKVTELVFYKSILKPTGPIYKPIKVFKLKS